MNLPWNLWFQLPFPVFSSGFLMNDFALLPAGTSGDSIYVFDSAPSGLWFDPVSAYGVVRSVPSWTPFCIKYQLFAEDAF
jgi:hypothetical protein